MITQWTRESCRHLVQPESLGKAFMIRTDLGRVLKPKYSLSIPSLAAAPRGEINDSCCVLCRSPSIMGILAADRHFLGEIGSLDGGMLIYGGENVELSLRVCTFPFSLWDKAERGIIER